MALRAIVPKEYVVKDADNVIYLHSWTYELWNGFGSTVRNNGQIMQYIFNYLACLPFKTVFCVRREDIEVVIPDWLEKHADEKKAYIIGTQVAGLKIDPRTFYCPASDDFFIQNVLDVLKPAHVPWNNKKNILFWRGGRSGEILRPTVVKKLVGVNQTDVKFINKWTRDDCNPKTNPYMFADRESSIEEHLQYKAILYIDGNSSASNATWIFASGSVPVFISNYDFWFKKYLVPWKHYIPIKDDLSDLIENIQWIWDNDDKAHKIVENALEFCNYMLSPRRQQDYIKEEIDKIITLQINTTATTTTSTSCSILTENQGQKHFKYYEEACFIINMEKSVDRLQHTMKEVVKAGFKNVEVFRAVDASDNEILKTAWKNHGNPKFKENDDKFIKYPGQQGCTLSHLNLWKHIIDNNIPVCTVFEDDIIFHKHWNRLAEEYMKVTPKDFDILYIGSDIADWLEFSENVIITSVFCTHAYIITLEGARKLYSLILNDKDGMRTIDCMIKDITDTYLYKNKSDIPPFIWYVWNGTMFHDTRSIDMSSKQLRNSGLVFQLTDFKSNILNYDYSK